MLLDSIAFSAVAGTVVMGVTFPLQVGLLALLKSRYLAIIDSGGFRLATWANAMIIFFVALTAWYSLETGQQRLGPLVPLLVPITINLCCLVTTNGLVKLRTPFFRGLIWIGVILLPFLITGAVYEVLAFKTGTFHHRYAHPPGTIAGLVIGFCLTQLVFFSFMSWIFQRPWREWWRRISLRLRDLLDHSLGEG